MAATAMRRCRSSRREGPSDCFDAAIEAVRLAVQFMTPVILLTDGYIANAAEPWKVPDVSAYEPFPVKFYDQVPAEGRVNPYKRDPETLKRLWIKPGTPGLTHRIGGIESNYATGEISYDPANHQTMTDARKAKIDGIANFIPEQEVALALLAASSPSSAGARPSGRSTRRCARARRRGRCQPHPRPPHLAAAAQPRRAAAQATRRSWCPR